MEKENDSSEPEGVDSMVRKEDLSRYTGSEPGHEPEGMGLKTNQGVQTIPASRHTTDLTRNPTEDSSTL